MGTTYIPGNQRWGLLGAGLAEASRQYISAREQKKREDAMTLAAIMELGHTSKDTGELQRIEESLELPTGTLTGQAIKQSSDVSGVGMGGPGERNVFRFPGRSERDLISKAAGLRKEEELAGEFAPGRLGRKVTEEETLTPVIAKRAGETEKASKKASTEVVLETAPAMREKAKLDLIAATEAEIVALKLKGDQDPEYKTKLKKLEEEYKQLKALGPATKAKVEAEGKKASAEAVTESSRAKLYDAQADWYREREASTGAGTDKVLDMDKVNTALVAAGLYKIDRITKKPVAVPYNEGDPRAEAIKKQFDEVGIKYQEVDMGNNMLGFGSTKQKQLVVIPPTMGSGPTVSGKGGMASNGPRKEQKAIGKVMVGGKEIEYVERNGDIVTGKDGKKYRINKK